mgnify:CR=1 FL=1
MDLDIPLVDAPKSNMVFLIKILSILQAIVNMPKSPHFDWSFLYSTADTFSSIITLSSPLSLLQSTHKSFKNFTYFGTSLIASSRKMLISILRNTSKISFSLSYYFGLSNLLGKGAGLVLTSMIGSGSTTRFLLFMSSASSSFSIFSSSLSFGVTSSGP